MSDELLRQQLAQLIENQSILSQKLDSSTDSRRKSDGKKVSEWVMVGFAVIGGAWVMLNHFHGMQKLMLQSQAELFQSMLAPINEKLTALSGQGKIDAVQNTRLSVLEHTVGQK